MRLEFCCDLASDRSLLEPRIHVEYSLIRVYLSGALASLCEGVATRR